MYSIVAVIRGTSFGAARGLRNGWRWWRLVSIHRTTGVGRILLWGVDVGKMMQRLLLLLLLLLTKGNLAVATLSNGRWRCRYAVAVAWRRSN
jgi:hypothetical protein